MDNNRLKKLQANLREPILIKKKENLQYLIGDDFNNVEGYLLVKKNEVVFFGSGLEKITGIKKVDRFKNIARHINFKQLDIEYNFTYAEGKYLQNRIKNNESRVKVNPVISPVDYQRAVKEAGEIAAVKKSMQIVESVFALVRREIKKSGMTEIKLANFITSTGLKIGAHNVSFPAIVASGANAAVPHHVPSSKVLKRGESIILDFGFKYKNYCSDFTRTVFLKTVPKKLEMAYNQTEKAYNESFNFARSGIRGGDVYQKSVDVLKEKHLEKYFIHSLGHGTGLEIHELPNLSPNSKDILKDGMVFSIEPGVYFPNLGGIRIEDLVYLENGKCKKFVNVLTNLKSNIF